MDRLYCKSRIREIFIFPAFSLVRISRKDTLKELETAIKIPPGIRSKYPEIPWKYIAGMRDKLIHEYHGVDLEIVWEVVKKEIPPLKPIFEKILIEIE